MDVFAVLAYNWGNPNDYGFLVGVFDTEAAAFAAADSTYGERGGKFDCEVLRLPKNHVFDGFDVPLVVRALEPPRPVHREPDPLRDGVHNIAGVHKKVIATTVVGKLDEAYPAVYFDDGTTTTRLTPFPSWELAQAFADGMMEAQKFSAESSPDENAA